MSSRSRSTTRYLGTITRTQLDHAADRKRPTPDSPSGCTCGGIGDTGSHYPSCIWSAR
jgi:hypothetical protein